MRSLLEAAMKALSGFVCSGFVAFAGCSSDLPPAPTSLGAAPVQYGAASGARYYNAPGQASPAAYNPQYASQTAVYQPTYSGGAIEQSSPAPLTPVSESWSEGRASGQAVNLLPASYAEESVESLPGQVTVLAGDTVYAISRRTGASPQAIISLNRLQAPFTLRVGDVIRVPATAVPPSAATQTAAIRVKAVAPKEGIHVVRSGDTLYSISRSTGVSVDKIARANRLREPFALNIGQSIKIPGAAGDAIEQPRQREARDVTGPTENVAEIARNVNYSAPAKPVANALFDWPVKGAIISAFGLTDSGRRNDGVNISAPVGTPVRAAADGDVVYRGSELQGYGNLLLIKHEDGFVTAYAHNDVMLVKKGERVRKGQVIAKVGQSGAASEPQLHFEIRQNLKAVDPVQMLGSL
jgi:murein DD-endopeptidase MepM/ murein hydrolase activator NlpD